MRWLSFFFFTFFVPEKLIGQRIKIYISYQEEFSRDEQLHDELYRMESPFYWFIRPKDQEGTGVKERYYTCANNRTSVLLSQQYALLLDECFSDAPFNRARYLFIRVVYDEREKKVITHLSLKNIPSKFLVNRSRNMIADISPMCSSVIFFDDAIRYRYIYLWENVSLTTYTAAGTRMDKIQPLFFPNDQSIYTYIFSPIYVLNIHVYVYLLRSTNFHFGLLQWKRIFNRWSHIIEDQLQI